MTGSISFADGELFQTISVEINDDSLLETNESLNLSISGTGLDFDRQAATLTIRDNDFNPFAGSLLLNEFWINSPGNDPPHEFVEIVGQPNIPMGSLYYVAFEGLVGDREGSAEKVVDIGAFQNGAADVDGNGYTVLTPDAADFAFNLPNIATQIDGLGSIGTENVASQNDSTTYMLLYSPLTSLTETEFDYDWDNDGALELPLGVQIVDSVGVRVLGAEDQLYGPATNQVEFDEVTDPEVDAISRIRGDAGRNEGDSWFGGDLEPGGDDYLLYEAAESFGLPLTGTALSPGEPNTGTAFESPLVSLLDVTLNPDGTVTATFSGPVSQLNSGDGGPASPEGAALTITNLAGDPLPTVEVEGPFKDAVLGLGTDTLTFGFAGSGVVNGMLPAGDYRLNFVGNAIISNARATDVANDGSQVNGFYSEVITVGEPTSGDFNNDGNFDCADIDALVAEIVAGTNNPLFDMNGDGSVTPADITDPGVGWLAVGGAQNPDDTGGNAFLSGDATLDGVVDVSDFNEWNANKFTNDAGWCGGDFTADGSVDVSDFNEWNANKFLSSSPGAPLINSAIDVTPAGWASRVDVARGVEFASPSLSQLSEC